MHRNKEPDITIKTALSAAFAKYSHRKKNKSQQKDAEGLNTSTPEANSKGNNDE
ncbi:unnamed protein product [Cuscuta epithymum]|nr:unnamed protein product [Cuscuta epithymum]